jgi:Tfp pilus assembly protein PilX
LNVVVVLTGELFDAIEVNAARTGNHKRAAVRMSRLAVQASPSGMSRAEAHVRAGEQWLLADEPATAAEEFRTAIADAARRSMIPGCRWPARCSRSAGPPKPTPCCAS